METIVGIQGDPRGRVARKPGEHDWPTWIALRHALLDRDPIGAKPLC